MSGNTNQSSISVIRNYTEIISSKSITEILAEIRQPKFTGPFTEIRKCYSEGNKVEGDRIKKQLNGFTISGQFDGGRKRENLIHYNPFIIIDIDDQPELNLTEVKANTSTDPHTYACFISPSGRGLKIIVPVTTGVEEHEKTYNAIADYYQNLLNVKIDRSGKDVNRLCFMSFDPEIYINEEAQPYFVSEVDNTAATFQTCIAITQNKQKYEEGSRNNFVYQLANNCKRFGLPLEAAQSLILEKYGYDVTEVTKSVESAYKNNPAEFGTFTSPTVQIESSSEATQLNLSGTPTLPNAIFENMPDLLRNGCRIFDDLRERDVFFTGALGVLSGCINNVKGKYGHDEVLPNMFTFVIAPPANGKGALNLSKQLAKKIHANLRVEKKQLFIPGNSSSSAMIKLLQKSEGRGIIFETEADVLSGTMKNEWGNLSDMLRRAFHNETISIARIDKDQYFEIEKPSFAIVLSGTPDQVKTLIPSANNGLFSRFIFYAYQSPLVWKNMEPSEAIDFSEYFDQLSDEVASVCSFLNSSPTEFRLSSSQWKKHTEIFGEQLIELTQFISIDTASTVKRLGQILFKTAMILTALRKVEYGLTDQEIICSNDDFEIAAKLTLTYLEHAKFIFNTLREKTVVNPKRRQLYILMPNEEFGRQDVIEPAKSIGIADRTLTDHLKGMVDCGLLTQPRFGRYKKV